MIKLGHLEGGTLEEKRCDSSLPWHLIHAAIIAGPREPSLLLSLKQLRVAPFILRFLIPLSAAGKTSGASKLLYGLDSCQVRKIKEKFNP